MAQPERPLFAVSLPHSAELDALAKRVSAECEGEPAIEVLRVCVGLLVQGLTGREGTFHAKQAAAWGPWCDLAAIVSGGVEQRAGAGAAAKAAWGPVDARLASAAGPGYVYREKLATWEQVHALPAVERKLLDGFRAK